jgi:hypothetical protein
MLRGWARHGARHRGCGSAALLAQCSSCACVVNPTAPAGEQVDSAMMLRAYPSPVVPGTGAAPAGEASVVATVAVTVAVAVAVAVAG